MDGPPRSKLSYTLITVQSFTPHCMVIQLLLIEHIVKREFKYRLSNGMSSVVLLQCMSSLLGSNFTSSGYVRHASAWFVHTFITRHKTDRLHTAMLKSICAQICIKLLIMISKHLCLYYIYIYIYVYIYIYINVYMCFMVLYPLLKLINAWWISHMYLNLCALFLIIMNIWFYLIRFIGFCIFFLFFIIHFHEHSMVWYNIFSVYNFIQIINENKQIYWMHN